MKKHFIKLVIAVSFLLMSFPGATHAGSDRFQTGFHEELGAIAARAAVGTAVGILGGVFGRGAPYVCGRGYGGWGYASPYEEAYAREAERIQRERYYRWIRTQSARGRRDARMHYGYR